MRTILFDVVLVAMLCFIRGGNSKGDQRVEAEDGRKMAAEISDQLYKLQP